MSHTAIDFETGQPARPIVGPDTLNEAALSISGVPTLHTEGLGDAVDNKDNQASDIGEYEQGKLPHPDLATARVMASARRTKQLSNDYQTNANPHIPVTRILPESLT
jgi:hypothetical protein